jgi:hypothetical protein
MTKRCALTRKGEAMSTKRIMATFVPEAWIRDHAVEIDGRLEFDVTERILAMSEKERNELRDDDYNTDGLASEEIRGSHTGPFRVEVEKAIEDYFSSNDDPSTTQL